LIDPGLLGAVGMTKSGETRGRVLAVITHLVVFALKLAVYFATGVMVLLTELHSLSDISSLAFYSSR
jgi:divalent metal cation (Fe/Co/Zn/Cd) transporter